MNPELTTVAEKLRFYREASALSQKQVASALNIDRTTYTKYETGKSLPSLNLISKIAVIYNVSPTELLPAPDFFEREAKQIRSSLNADSPIYQLSKQERGLVVLFRVLNNEDKAKALELLGDMAKKTNNPG